MILLVPRGRWRYDEASGQLIEVLVEARSEPTDAEKAIIILRKQIEQDERDGHPGIYL